MPFSHTPKNPGDLIKSDDWNKALNGVVDLFTKFTTAAAGHSHSGTGENGPQIKDTGIANDAITNAKIQNNAVTAAKILDGTISAAKMAAGVLPRDIGVAISGYLGGAFGLNVPIPTGFTISECIFFVAVRYIYLTPPAAYTASGLIFWHNVTTDGNGLVNITKSDNLTIYLTALALGKKGGW